MVIGGGDCSRYFQVLESNAEKSGVIGLAVARALTLAYPEKSTLLLERNGFVGEETRCAKCFLGWEHTQSIISSRNSEVIHAGKLS